MIDQQGKTIVVFGATGKQGRAVIDALQDSATAWNVVGVTRNVTSDSAKALSARGVRPVAGDMGDVESLKAAMDGAFGVYSIQANFENDHDGREVRFGRNVVDAAHNAGVSHFVYGSVGGAERGLRVRGGDRVQGIRRVEL